MDNLHKIKVLYIVNIPAPYRVDFFNKLGRYCELTVLYEGVIETHRRKEWIKTDADGYKAVYLHPHRIGKRTISFDVIDYITSDIDCIIVGAYNTPTCILAMSYMKKKKIPYIINVDGGIVKEKELIFKKILKTWLLGSANYWLSPSKSADMYLLYYGGKQEQIFRYHFTSLSEKDIHKAQKMLNMRAELRSELNIQEKVMILSVGRFNLAGGYGKGYDTLMTVAEHYAEEDIGFYIVGDTPTEEFVKWKNDRDLQKVHFIGFQDKSSIQKYYASADIFILLTRSDVWGLVINEAMAFNLPVITTDKCVAGLELVRNGENGYIVAVNKPKEVIDRIDELLYEQDINKIKRTASERISKYTIENMVKDHLDAFGEIICRNCSNKRHG